MVSNMANEMKEILVHGHDSGPNPWKVIMVMEELGLPYKHVGILLDYVLYIFLTGQPPRNSWVWPKSSRSLTFN
jgi:hypothetical protein